MEKFVGFAIPKLTINIECDIITTIELINIIMKREVISFKSPKARNTVARAMLDRDGPYRPRVEADRRRSKRNEKHRKNFWDYSDRFYL